MASFRWQSVDCMSFGQRGQMASDVLDPREHRIASEDVVLHQIKMSKIFVWVQTFLNRIRALFYDQMCLCSGYTQVMLTHLKASLCVVVDGQPWQCGHPDTAALPNPLVKRCLGRLEAWVKDRQKFHHHTHNHHNHQFGAHRPLPTLFVQLWFCFSPNKACT